MANTAIDKGKVWAALTAPVDPLAEFGMLVDPSSLMMTEAQVQFILDDLDENGVDDYDD